MRRRLVGTTLLVAGVLASVVVGGGNAAAHPAAAQPAGTPTPQAAKGELTGDITFSVPSGAFADEVEVELESAVRDAEIRYTTDGQVPDATSDRYDEDEPLVLTETTQLRAQPFRNGKPAGEVGTALYLASSVTTEHHLPIVVLDVYGAGRPKRDFMDTAIMTFEPDDGETTTMAAEPTLVSRAGIHVRGRSSATFPQTAYRLELRDNQDKDADYPFLGMPDDSDWAFRSPYFDKSLIRDAFTYGIGRDLGRLNTPRVAFCELYLNVNGGPITDADYQGVYLASETIKISSDRLDVTKMKKADLAEPEIEGGYVVKFDHQVAEEPMIKCTGPSATCWNWLEVVEPDPLQPEQREWLTDYLNEFNNLLHSPDFADPETGYPAWIDVPSFVDFVIINEFSRNLDGYMKSSYFYKDRRGKLTAGPLWDYDLAWGNGGIRDNTNPAGWQYVEQYRSKRAHGWITQLFSDPAFVAQVSARWRELRRGVLSDQAIDERVDSLSTQVTEAADRNFSKWKILTKNHLVSWVSTPTESTWERQVEYTSNWIHQRAQWLDSQWLDSWPPLRAPHLTGDR